MTIDEAIKHCEDVIKQCNLHLYTHPEQLDFCEKYYDANKCAEDHYQLAEWLKILKRVKFEFDEAIRIIYHPTPDVRDSDRKRAYAVIDTFLFLQKLDER